MVAIYRQQPVTVIRAAREGDPDFDAACKEEQLLIKNGDGSQTVAPKGQVVVTEDQQPSKTEASYPRMASNQKR